MSSAEDRRAARRARGAAIDRALAESHQGRDRLRQRADAEVPASHGQKSRRLPGVRTEEPL